MIGGSGAVVARPTTALTCGIYPPATTSTTRSRTDTLATKGTIYTLTDPRDESIRYVGQTKRNLHRRLTEHLTHATNPAMRVWIHGLALQGLVPRIDVIAEPKLEHIKEEETRQIQRHAEAGHKIFNAPYYRLNITDLYEKTVPALAVSDQNDAGDTGGIAGTLKSNDKAEDVSTRKINECAHRYYGYIAAASVTRKIPCWKAAAKVLFRSPVVVLACLWYPVARIVPMRWVSRITLYAFGAWAVGFGPLVRDKVLPYLPLHEAGVFWRSYLERPVTNLCWSYLVCCVLTALTVYFPVRESVARRATRPLKTKTPVPPVGPDDLVVQASRALDAAVASAQRG